MHAYRRSCIEDDQVMIDPPAPLKRLQSDGALRYFAWLRHCNGWNIRDALSADGEYRVILYRHRERGQHLPLADSRNVLQSRCSHHR